MDKVEFFVLAEWIQGAAEGPAQCFYDDHDNHDYLGVYLAKHHLVPAGNNPYQWRGDKYEKTCDTGLAICQFEDHVVDSIARRAIP